MKQLFKRITNQRRTRGAYSHRESLWVASAALILITVSNSFEISPAFGQIVVGAYGLAAVLLSIPSIRTFEIAFLILAAAPIMITLQGESDLTETFAAYAFLLIAVGVISALSEKWRRDQRLKRSKSVEKTGKESQTRV